MQTSATDPKVEIKAEKVEYNGKHFTVPILSDTGFTITPNKTNTDYKFEDKTLLEEMNTIWDLKKFKQVRNPLVVGKLDEEEAKLMKVENNIRILDMPIKFPGSNEFRVPKELAQFVPVVQKIANIELDLNPDRMVDYYCYITVAQNFVHKGALQREAPCHVDGFQGALWNPKVEINHTYTVETGIPTSYYVQPFDFDALDESKHNFFWEMNRQVAATNSAYAKKYAPAEIVLMNAYCVHRGSPAPEDMYRTWLRFSFEVRQFNRLGNAHNPMFEYKWDMMPRDIESLGLVPYDTTCDASLRVFPWEKVDGGQHEHGEKTQPKLISN